RLRYPERDDRVLDEGIGANDINRLRALFSRDLLKRAPDELQGGRRILAAAVTDHPWNAVGRIEIGDLPHRGGQRLLKAGFREGRGRLVTLSLPRHFPPA